MKKYLALSSLIFTALISTGFKSSYPSHIVSQGNQFSLTEDAPEIINDIIAIIGLKSNFEVRPGNIPNAAAVTYKGKRYIVYNPQFISKLNAAAGNKWASVSVLAHEIGHHLNGHTLTNTGSQPALELEADEFSGFVLRKMGASLADAQVAMKIAAAYKPSLTHPGQEDRLFAIAKGWNKASEPVNTLAKYNKPDLPLQSASTADVAAKRDLLREKTEKMREGASDLRQGENTVLDTKFIFANVNFHSDPAGNYYVTTSYNFVRVLNGKLYILGNLLPTTNTNYPYILKSPERTLFIDRQGKIVTSNRQVAGFLRT